MSQRGATVAQGEEDPFAPPPLSFAPAAPPAGPRPVLLWLERLGILVASLGLSFVLIALLSGFFAANDQAGLSGDGAPQLGQSFPDQGNGYLRPGQPRPAYDSNPPTSGAHLPEPIQHPDLVISDDQLLQALALGDVVILYGTPAPPPGLAALAREVSGAFSPALAGAGQAVIPARRPGTDGLIGLAWTRMVRVSTPAAATLRAVAEQWLGRGAARG